MKVRFLALAALVLGMVSCQQDVETIAPVGGEVDFQLSVAAPELVGTRAGDKGQADTQNAMNSAFGAIDYLQGAATGDYRQDWGDVDLRYTLEVYDVADDYTGKTPVKDRQVIIKDSYEPVVFDLRLVPNRDYHFVVFADFVAQDEYKKDASAQLGVNGIRHEIGATLADITVFNEAINDEVADSYFATKDIKVTNSAAQDIVLKRPYGKLRVIATDLAELNLNVDPKSVVVEYESFNPNKFNAVTGAIAGEYTAKSFATSFVENVRSNMGDHYYTAGYDAETAPAVADNGIERNTHITLFTDYILAEDAQKPIHFTMTVNDEEGKEIKTTSFYTDIPVQRNYLTTVVGNVLTTATHIEVSIDDNFAGNHYFNLWDGMSATMPEYDDATKTYIVREASELAWVAAQVNGTTRATAQTFEGYTIKLAKDIHLNGELWNPIGATGQFKGTFDGDGHKIEGLFVSTEGRASAGLFANCRGTIKNLTVIDAEIYGNYKAGVISGDGLCAKIENCHVKDAIVESTPWLTNKGYDDGNNVGGIVGYLSAEPTAYVKGCTVKNAKITAYRKVGGIVGAANSGAEVTGNTIESSVITADMTAEYKEVKPADAGAVVGCLVTNDNKVEDNTVAGGINTANANAVKVFVYVKDASGINNNSSSAVVLPAGEYTFTEDVKSQSIQVREGEVEITAGNIETGNANQYGFVAEGENTSLVINDANINSLGGGIGASDGAQVTFKNGKLAVNSASTSGRYLFYVVGEGTVVTIDGGEFSFSSTLNQKRAYVYTGTGAKVIINGGTFGKASTRADYKAGIMGTGETIIYGGTFGFDPTEWVSEDSRIEKVGSNWVVYAAPVLRNADELNAALTTNYIEGQTIYLAQGNYEGMFDFTGKKLTVKSAEGAQIKGLVWAYNSDVKFEGVHFTNPDGVQHPNPDNSKYFNDINKQYPLVAAYGNADIEFEGCTFHITGPTVYGFYGYATINPTFNNCKFECNGIRPIANNGDKVTVTGCTFENAYHYAVRIFENAGNRMTIVFKNNVMTGSNTKGEFEGINISKKGTTATVFADFAIEGNTADLKYRYHKNVTLDASCTGAELFEQEQ